MWSSRRWRWNVGSITLIQGPIGLMVVIGPEWIWMQPRLPTKHMIGNCASAARCIICATASLPACQA